MSQHLSKMYYGFWYKQPQLILLSIIANGTFIAPSNKKASRVNSYYKSAPFRPSAYNTCKRTYAIFYCPEQLDMLFDSCYVGNYYAYINNSSVEKNISFFMSQLWHLIYVSYILNIGNSSFHVIIGNYICFFSKELLLGGHPNSVL